MTVHEKAKSSGMAWMGSGGQGAQESKALVPWHRSEKQGTLSGTGRKVEKIK